MSAGLEEENTQREQEPIANANTDDKRNSWERVKENRQNLINTIKEEIAKGGLEWQHYLSMCAAPHNGETNRPYHGLNRMYLTLHAHAKGYKDPRWYTFNQVKNANLNVKKGEKGCRIEKFTVWDKEQKKEIKSRKDLEEITKGMSDDEKLAYEKENIRTYVNQYVVFNGEQVAGLDKYQPKTISEEDKNAVCEAVLENSFVPIEYVDNSITAYYDMELDKVVLPNREKFVSADELYSTAFHELAHATGSKERLARDMSHKEDSYAQEEVVAELSALFTQQDLGVQLKNATIKNSSAYIESWERVLDKPEAFWSAVTSAEKATAYIVENTKEKQNTVAKQNDEKAKNEAKEEVTYQDKKLLSPKEYYANKNAKRIDDIVANTPKEMKDLKNWCVFKTYYEKETNKKKKVILSPETGMWGKCNDSSTWSSFEKAVEYARANNCEGLSFALDNAKNGIACVDLDGCINNKGMRSELCWKVLNASDGTYAEKSVSGKGVHVFFKADGITNGYNQKDDVKGLECYDNSKFISITGNTIGKTNELKNASDKLVQLLHDELGKKSTSQITSATLRSNYELMSNREVLDKIRASKIGDTFERLYGGEDIFGDKSRSDAKLLSIIGFFTDYNPGQMKELFENSGLHRPEKGDKYVDRTINFVTRTALQRPSKMTAPSSKANVKGKGSNKSK